MSTQVIQQTGRLPATTAVGPIRLRVTDLNRSLAFYRDVLGFTSENGRDGEYAVLSRINDATLIALRELPGLERAPRQVAGLYHFAILLPSRVDLARFVRHLIERSIPFGHSDHGVSEALYFDDPDGIGIEVYADRRRESWPVVDGKVRFTGHPIDIRGLLGILPDEVDRWSEMPVGAQIGHIHLRVSNLKQSGNFYINQLGLDLTANEVSGALFASAGGYHHHLGMNVWESSGASLGGDEVAGLDSFSIVLPDKISWESALHRVGGSTSTSKNTSRVRDPDGIELDLTYPG